MKRPPFVRKQNLMKGGHFNKTGLSIIAENGKDIFQKIRQ